MKNSLVPSSVIDRYAFKTNLPKVDVYTLFVELEAFLEKASMDTQEPNPTVDGAWHEFILHTKEYSQYCYERFGKFIHHVPNTLITCSSEEEDKPPKCGTCSSGITLQVSIASCSSTNCTNCRSEIA